MSLDRGPLARAAEEENAPLAKHASRRIVPGRPRERPEDREHKLFGFPRPLELQRPLPADTPRIVASGEREDGVPA